MVESKRGTLNISLRTNANSLPLFLAVLIVAERMMCHGDCDAGAYNVGNAFTNNLHVFDTSKNDNYLTRATPTCNMMCCFYFFNVRERQKC